MNRLSPWSLLVRAGDRMASELLNAQQALHMLQCQDRATRFEVCEDDACVTTRRVLADWKAETEVPA